MKVSISGFPVHPQNCTFQHQDRGALSQVENNISWVTTRNTMRMHFFDASCTATAHICSSSADETWHWHSKWLATSTSWRRPSLCNFNHLDTASLLHFFLFLWFSRNQISLFCLTEADKVIYCFLQTGWAFPSKSFCSKTDNSSQFYQFPLVTCFWEKCPTFFYRTSYIKGLRRK